LLLSAEPRYLSMCKVSFIKSVMSAAIRIAATITVATVLIGCRERPADATDWINSRGRGAEIAYPPFSVSAVLEEKAGAIKLKFKLTNVSGKALDAYPFQLPWGIPNLVGLLAVTAKGKIIKGSRYDAILDPNYQKEMHIAAGESVFGDVDIGNRFSLTPLPRNEDTIILWSYTVPSHFGQDRSVCSGSVILPAKSEPPSQNQ